MKNIGSDTPERRFEKIISELAKKLDDLKTNQLSSLIVPKVASDPASPVNGMIWYNTTSHELKVYKNGSVRTVTTS
jgi:hypothetical protein